MSYVPPDYSKIEYSRIEPKSALMDFLKKFNCVYFWAILGMAILMGVLSWAVWEYVPGCPGL